VDDLRLLDELTGDAPLADLRELAPARARLDAELTAGSCGRIRSYRHVRPGRRLLWSTAAVGVAAAVAAAVLVTAQQHPTSGPRMVDAGAAQVLNTAAAAALRLPDTAPRPDQFIYSKYSDDGATGEAWLSVDGTRDSLSIGPDGNRQVMPGCRDGVMQVHGNYHGTRSTPCTPVPEYLTDLPTNADAMLDYLKHHIQGDPNDANAVGKTVMGLVSHDMPPRSRAALYQAAARFPGLGVDRHAVDGAGRHGIAITWHYSGGCAPSGCARDFEIIFDPMTYTLLGVRNGTSATALLQTAVVDSVGQRP
jgi:hypothetical protein